MRAGPRSPSPTGCPPSCNADVIFVVDGGQVVERGTHAELLARGGLYARLYAEQFDGGRVEARCSDGVVFSDGVVLQHAPVAGTD